MTPSLDLPYAWWNSTFRAAPTERESKMKAPDPRKATRAVSFMIVVIADVCSS